MSNKQSARECKIGRLGRAVLTSPPFSQLQRPAGSASVGAGKAAVISASAGFSIPVAAGRRPAAGKMPAGRSNDKVGPQDALLRRTRRRQGVFNLCCQARKVTDVLLEAIWQWGCPGQPMARHRAGLGKRGPSAGSSRVGNEGQNGMCPAGRTSLDSMCMIPQLETSWT